MFQIPSVTIHRNLITLSEETEITLQLKMCSILITFIIINRIIQNINRMRNHIKRQELRVSKEINTQCVCCDCTAENELQKKEMSQKDFLSPAYDPTPRLPLWAICINTTLINKKMNEAQMLLLVETFTKVLLLDYSFAHFFFFFTECFFIFV